MPCQREKRAPCQDLEPADGVMLRVGLRTWGLTCATLVAREPARMLENASRVRADISTTEAGLAETERKEADRGDREACAR